MPDTLLYSGNQSPVDTKTPSSYVEFYWLAPQGPHQYGDVTIVGTVINLSNDSRHGVYTRIKSNSLAPMRLGAFGGGRGVSSEGIDGLMESAAISNYAYQMISHTSCIIVTISVQLLLMLACLCLD